MLNADESYLLGFLQTDGHRRQTPGKSKPHDSIHIELSIKDIDILEKIRNRFHIENDITMRTRDTNFKKEYTSCNLTITSKMIENLLPYLPSSKKSLLIEAPKNEKYSESDYWRGIFDGDGSLGLRILGGVSAPYISLTTSSDGLYTDLQKYLSKMCNIYFDYKINKRDNIYNITFSNVNTFRIVSLLYKNATLFIDRKYKNAIEIYNFDHRSVSIYKWNNEEDLIVYNNDASIAGVILNRPGNTVGSRKKQLINLVEAGILDDKTLLPVSRSHTTLPSHNMDISNISTKLYTKTAKDVIGDIFDMKSRGVATHKIAKAFHIDKHKATAILNGSITAP